MPMREECKHFQSRTYASGETARFCVLDLAPEAPWRCPEGCPRYEVRRSDVGWTHGSLVEPAIEDEPEVPAANVAELLDEAEDIVNAVVATTRDEVRQERRTAEQTPWQRALRRVSRRRTSGGRDDGGEFGGRRGGR